MNIVNYINYFNSEIVSIIYYNKNNIINFCILLFFTYSFDVVLIKIFGAKARWFQIHCLLNCIVLFNITPFIHIYFLVCYCYDNMIYEGRYP